MIKETKLKKQTEASSKKKKTEDDKSNAEAESSKLDEIMHRIEANK